MTHYETTVGDGIVQRLPQARDLGNGQCRVDGTDQRSDGVRGSAYREMAAHHHHRRARRGRTEHTSRRHIDTTAGEETPLIASLRERFVILRADFVVARKASDVTNNADDRLPWKQWPQSHSTANGIGIRPISCGHRLVDDDHRWRCRRVKGSEVASFK